MTMIVYALVDPRTHQVRYIGKSKNGLPRPLDTKSYKDNPRLYAWLYDLESTKTAYTVLVLAEAFTEPQLAMFEAHWIATGDRFGWPLANKHKPKDKVEEIDKPGSGRRPWDVKEWRRERKAAAAIAKLQPKPPKPDA